MTEEEQKIHRLNTLIDEINRSVKENYYDTFRITYDSKGAVAQDIKYFLNLIQKQQEESEEKDKIIDEILKELINQYGYFEPCYLDGEMGCKEYKNYEDCVKRYIEKKVKENDYEKNI